MGGRVTGGATIPVDTAAESSSSLPALFTKDARMEVLGQTFVGRDKIHARIEAGIGGPVFRHLISSSWYRLHSAAASSCVAF